VRSDSRFGFWSVRMMNCFTPISCERLQDSGKISYYASPGDRPHLTHSRFQLHPIGNISIESIGSRKPTKRWSEPLPAHVTFQITKSFSRRAAPALVSGRSSCSRRPMRCAILRDGTLWRALVRAMQLSAADRNSCYNQPRYLSSGFPSPLHRAVRTISSFSIALV